LGQRKTGKIPWVEIAAEIDREMVGGEMMKAFEKP